MPGKSTHSTGRDALHGVQVSKVAEHKGAVVRKQEQLREHDDGNAHKARKARGCLIHLSGVVKGLDAGNSIEC